MKSKDRIVRLKDGSLAVCLPSEDKFRYIRIGDNSSGIVRGQSRSGWSHSPVENRNKWEDKFTLDESDVDYELRFRMGQYVMNEDGGIAMQIVGIPANSGSGDYTINRMGSSTSYTIHDPGFVEVSQEQAEKTLADWLGRVKIKSRIRRYNSAGTDLIEDKKENVRANIYPLDCNDVSSSYPGQKWGYIFLSAPNLHLSLYLSKTQIKDWIEDLERCLAAGESDD